LSVLVRIVVMFVAVVVAADQLDFARSVFLAAFIILVGGGVLTASLAVGLHGSGLRRLLQGQQEQQTEDNRERSLWNHL
jgi:small-conductance mechanosensitive channel